LKEISRTKASFINLIFNYSSAIFAIFNGLILMPLYLKYFTIGTYGSYLSSGNIVAIIGLLDGGMSYVLTQRLATAYSRKEYNLFSKIIGSGFFISSIVVLLLLIVGFSFMPFISNWVKASPGEYRNIQIAFFLSAVGAGLGIFFHNISSVFQAILKIKISGYVNLISSLIGILTTLISLHIKLGVISIPLGLLARNLFGIFILFFYLILIFKKEKIPNPSININNCKDLFYSVVPMLGGGVAKSLVTNSQLLIITTFINPSSAAVFFITSRIYLVCDSFLAPISSSIFSSISQIFATGDMNHIRNTIVKVFNIFNFISALILSLSFVMNSSFISLYLGEDKFGGNLLSGMLCINMLLYTRYTFIGTNLYAIGVFGKTVFYDILGGIVKIFLIVVLIKFIGYIAVPIAEFLSTIFFAGYYLNKLITSKLEFRNSEVRKFIFLGIELFLIVIVISTLWIVIIPTSENWESFIFKSFSFLFFLSTLMSILDKKIKNLIRTAFFFFINKI